MPTSDTRNAHRTGEMEPSGIVMPANVISRVVRIQP